MIRKADERGRTRLEWLDSRHSFSFADYYDPNHMGFSSLRVINDDRVAPGAGFPTHAHRDMEIITYVLSGTLEHRDSMGNGSIIRPGEVQRMSAGTGITHSEFNPSSDEALHLLQIWILPARQGLKPSYEQRPFNPDELRGRLRLVGSPERRDDAVTIHQDARMYAGILAAGASTEFEIARGRKVYLQVARGGVSVNAQALEEGDGASFEHERQLELRASTEAELLLFDLA
ncbi:MAG: pirin family protein [Candidatus Binataceae bacterium]